MTRKEFSAMSSLRRTRRFIAMAVTMVCAGTFVAAAAPAQAAGFVPISGSGSTWSQNALDQWRRNVDQFGIKVNYSGTGSSDGRNQFRNGTVDYAVTEIPYGLKDNGVVDQPPARNYAYMPIVAGGTSLMYNLKIAGKRVTNLRLSGPVIASIFTGGIKTWNDAAIQKDNPGLSLPAQRIVPVVRSDGSGTTAQFTSWLAATQASKWNAYCSKASRPSPCGQTSFYPVIPGSGFVAQSGSLGVSGYVSQDNNVGTITYVEYSYALNTGYPVAKVLNRAGYYVEPTPNNTAVGLLKATVNTNPNSAAYLTANLSGVYNNPDRRSYPLSSYSYIVVPTKIEGTFSANKGRTLGEFSYYFLCEGQRQAPALGYSPLPINLVQAGLTQVKRIPGVETQKVDIKKCNNPTFSADGTNLLAKNAPFPQACDKAGSTQCATGTGGAKQATAVKSGTSGSTGGGSTTGSTGGGSSGTGATGTGTTGTDTTTTGGTSGAVIDPETGLAVGGGETGGQAAIAATALSLSSGTGWGVQQAAMLMAAVMLIALMFAPPLVARSMKQRRSS
jgi:phosphate ABC transporter phosphate-binding protein